METKKFFIAGVQHHDLHKILVELEEGEELILTPEPTNKFDPNAIRIEYGSLDKGDIVDIVMLGYVPKRFSAEVAAALEIGELACIITKLNKDAKPWEQCEVTIQNFVEEYEDEEFDPEEE